MRLWVALAFGASSACSFVVGTNKYVLGDAGDATVDEAGEDAGGDAPYVDAGPDVVPCSNAPCLAEAGVCGSACGVTAASCIANCTNTPCKNNCMNADTACRNACTANCNACTVSAGCQDPVGCADASAM